ncbi:MAG: HlyD family efflux transporter periplasmic adaptor subunit [Huintestinicola sp.]
MENGIMKVLFVLLAGLILCSVFNGVYTNVTEEYKTQTAVIYSSADKTSFRGVYIRDESVIRKSYTGVLSYPISDGSKVANGSVVAYVYGSENDIEINRKIKELSDEIDLLKAAQNPGTVLTADPSFISSLISQRYQAVATRLAKRDISDIKSQRDDLLTLMSIYQISVKQEEGYDDRIAELNGQIDELVKMRKSSKSEIVSPDSGYFVSCTDGYENVLTIDKSGELTAETIKQVIAGEGAAKSANNEIGKLVRGYNWKIAGIIDNSDSVYNPGDTVKLKFASTPDTVTATIEFLEPTEDPKEWTLILRCDEMTFDLVQKRVERVEMTLNDFEGIKVPREALRFNKNNEKGCYVLWGQRVLFKKVDPIFESEEYLLSRLTSNEEYVCVYDDIIIKGVDTAAYMANSDEIVTKDEPEEEIPRYTDAVISETEPPAEETESSEQSVSEETTSEAPAETEQTLSENNSEGEVHFE